MTSPAEHARLDRRADRDHFVGVDALVRLLAEELLDDLLHLRDTRRAADEHHLVDLREVDARIGERLLGRADRPLQQIVHELLELRARELHLQVLRTRLVGGDERQVDVGLHHGGELHLGLLCRLFQALQRHPVLAQIDAFALLELRADPVDDALIEVVAAEMRVAVGRLHFEDAFADFENRDIERAAAEVVDGNRLVLLLVEAVRQRRGRRLVDDAHHFEAGDLPGIFRRLPLRVVEIRRDGDDRLAHLFAEVLLRGLLQLLQDHRGDLRRRILLAVRRDARIAVARAHDLVRHHLHLFGDFVELAPHEALDREDGVLGVRDRLALGHLADKTLACLREGDDRRRHPAAFRIGDDDWLTAFHDGDHRVGRAQIDTDDFAH